MRPDTTLTLLDRWLRIERAEAARHRALDASGQHSAAADAAEHEDRVRILEALRGVVETLQPGDRPHAVSALRGNARGQRHLADQCRDVETLRDQYTAQAERLERAADALAKIGEAVGR